MTANAQPIVARKPESTTKLRAAPAGPIGLVPLPSAPLIVIAGRAIPVIQPFERAAAHALATLVVSTVPSARAPGSNSAFGLLTVDHNTVQSMATDLGAVGSAEGLIKAGLGTKIVVDAKFGASGRIAATNAGFGALAALSGTVIPNLTVPALFGGDGTSTASIAYPASFAAVGLSTGEYTQRVHVSDPAAAEGVAKATVVVLGSAVPPTNGHGAGTLSAEATPKATGQPVAAGAGTLSFVTGDELDAQGTGALSATVGVLALFGSVTGTAARVSFLAAGDGSGSLAALTRVWAAAAFAGAGALIGEKRAVSAAGVGTLSAVTGGRAEFGSTGVPVASTGQITRYPAEGIATATVVPGFQPSGMTKSGAQVADRTWVTVTGWTPTAGYPGSTIVDNGLRAQGTKTGATLTANVAFTGGGSFYSHQARLLVNGTPVATGTAVSADTGTLVVTTTANVVNTDVISVQVITNVPTYITPFSITSGATTFVRIT